MDMKGLCLMVYVVRLVPAWSWVLNVPIIVI